MALLDKLESSKCVETVWGKLIPEKEAYQYAVRQIAAFCANLFQVMRILEPDFEKRTSAICEISYMMNMSASSDLYMQEFFNEWNIPEFCKRDAWLAVLAAVDFVREHLGVEMERSVPVCTYSARNGQCIGRRCPFSAAT